MVVFLSVLCALVSSGKYALMETALSEGNAALAAGELNIKRWRDQVILHVGALGRFIPPFINFVREEFDRNEHQFWFVGASEKYPVDLDEKVYLCGNGVLNRLKGYLRLVVQLHCSNKVMLHGLFNTHILIILALCPWVLKKCYWMIWGGDLYSHSKARNTLIAKAKEALRRFVISRIGHLVTYIEGDVELARQWYGAKGQYHECLLYLSNVVEPSVLSPVQECCGTGVLRVLVGNSADPSNDHIPVLERLRSIDDANIFIYVPLSYGDERYARKIVEKGVEWFGDRFIPLTAYMPFQAYLDFLKGMDIAVFNHRRQQAMGNTITLLGMGKNVYMRTDVTQWGFLNDLGLTVGDVDNFLPRKIDRTTARVNADIIRAYFSRTTLKRQLSSIFER